MATFPQSSEKIVIVGAGCFGISTAYHLLKRGFSDITILDRSPELPALDAASNDLNKIVRSSYSDLFYAKLTREAILAWSDQEEWGNTYHEQVNISGVVVLGLSSKDAYADEAYKNDVELGANLKPLPDGDAIRAIFPPQVPTASFSQQEGYLNKDGGWANAGQGLSIMISKVVSLGGKVFPGKAVTEIKNNNAIKSICCRDGSVYDASLVVIATGSWTPSTFSGLTSGYTFGMATGQCVAMLQLTDEEVEVYKDCPVVLDFESGYYVFPPNERGIVKMAMHLAGYTHTNGGISTPRTLVTDPVRGLLIPKANLQQMREHLRGIYPSLGKKPLSATRLCWYNDSPDGNWIIGRDPEDRSLVFATAGSGHAYKFLPVIGRLVADIIQGTMEPSLISKFAVERRYSSKDYSRRDMLLTELELDQLCTPEDLL